MNLLIHSYNPLLTFPNSTNSYHHFSIPAGFVAHVECPCFGTDIAHPDTASHHFSAAAVVVAAYKTEAVAAAASVVVDIVRIAAVGISLVLRRHLFHSSSASAAQPAAHALDR